MQREELEELKSRVGEYRGLKTKAGKLKSRDHMRRWRLIRA